jgi:hypothetical protein
MDPLSRSCNKLWADILGEGDSLKLDEDLPGGVTMLDSFLKSPRSRFRAAMVLAVVADALQIAIFPLFAEGAVSPVDDILDVVVMAALIGLIGWNWEFLPSFVGELVPGLDLVPFWTLAVANAYRKWKRAEGGVRQIDVEPIDVEPMNVEPADRKLPNP